MEEENKKNQPNLPSNYVTLLQLRERWINEQKRKQEEKEKQKEEKNDVVLVNNEKSKSSGEGMKKKNYQKKKEKSKKESKKEENENGNVEPEVKKRRNRREKGKKVGDDVAEESDRTVEIAEKLESVKVEEEKEVSWRRKSGYIRKNNQYNGKSGYHNGRRNGEFRGYDRDFGHNGWNNRRDDGNQKVWVKKEHIVELKDGKLS